MTIEERAERCLTRIAEIKQGGSTVLPGSVHVRDKAKAPMRFNPRRGFCRF